MGARKPDLERRSGSASGGAIDAARAGSDADQAAADADQAAADADQAAADADQAAADQDDAYAANDQRDADAGQVSVGQDQRRARATVGRGPYEAGLLTPEATKAGRIETKGARSRTAQSRARTAAERDASGAARDETAIGRDIQDEAMEDAFLASGSPLARTLAHARDRAAAAGARAAAARSRAAASDERAVNGEAGAARERALLEAELLSAHLDDLTGALRREMGMLALNQEIDRARRGDGRFVVAFADVDGLKRVNDRDGHAAGDLVLKTVAYAMRARLRSFDPIVRYGGDEFVCGLGGVDHDVVARRFEVIDRAVQSDVGVGISVGLARLEPDDTLDLLTARADAALLDAKKRRGSERGAQFQAFRSP